MEDRGKVLISIFNQLVGQRKNLEGIWADAYRYTMPYRGIYFQNKTVMPENVSYMDDAAKIYDSTASDSVSLLAASIMSGLTPSSSQWFQFAVPDVKYENLPFNVRVWLEDAAKKLFNLIHNASNYNAVALECLEDIGISGQFAMFITKEPGEGFIFELWPMDTLYIQENVKTKVVDTIYRLIFLTIKEAVVLFGLDQLSQEMQGVYRSNPNHTRLYEFVHVIKPREGKPGVFEEDMAYASIYVCKDSGMIVKESGFHEMPVVVPRWSKLPQQPYAIGPVTKAMPDIKTLNAIIEMMLQNAELAIAGMFLVKADGYLTASNIKIEPGALVEVADTNNIKPITTAGDFRISFEEITRLQNQIRKVMMSENLEPISKNYASATEVAQRAQIVRQILGPIFARLQSEFLEPLLYRCFHLALRDGTLGEVPQELNGVQLIPTYVSPIARASRLEEVTAMTQFEQMLASTAQLNPGVLDSYDFDAATIRKAELLGVPADVIRSKDQIKMIREQQAQAQAQAQQEEQMSQLTDPAQVKNMISAADSKGVRELMSQISGNT